jgi:serine/threonine-protein kinase RsbT
MRLGMRVLRADKMAVESSEDVVQVRQRVRTWAVDLGLNLVDQTKIITAASELARNAVVHGGGGTVELELVEVAQRRGLRLTFEDRGPGIPDIQAALRDGFTTGTGLGLGLGGAKRLSNEFEIASHPGLTRVRIVRWK